ncbi:alpha/beta fold hydrolase [Paenibacillus sp. GCM10027626]|uniref:alpha/beta fold hydrolase n=1 Tax=Paenibacillus sp. GCM10027626 TaxID=3273411 RepID=UPI00362D25B5
MPLANINGVILHYHKHGDDGIPIVFIHPPLLTSTNFRYQQVQLSNEFQVITFDIRGHGQSGQSDTPFTYELIVEDMRQLLNHLGIRQAYVCGYSTGGSIALQAMLTHPDRFTGGILISTMSETSDFILKNQIRLAIGLSKWRPVMRLMALGISWSNSDQTLTFQNLLQSSLRGDRRTIKQYYEYSLKYNCTAKLGQIKGPILLLYGQKDRRFKRYLKKLQNGLPQYELHLIQNENHQLPTKAADEMNDVIRRWIRAHEYIDSVAQEHHPSPSPAPFMMYEPVAEESVEKQ